MSYLHSKFHDNLISNFRGVAMTRFWDEQTDGRTDGWSDCTPRPAFAFGDAGKNVHDTLTGCWVIPIFNKICIFHVTYEILMLEVNMWA